MERGKREVRTVGTSLSTILFVVFLVLKLVGVINWSWWWVTAPLWIPLGIALVLVLIIFVFYWINTSYVQKKKQK